MQQVPFFIWCPAMPHGDFSLPVTNPVLIIALVMLVVLLAPLLFARLRVPGIVGLIVAGILIGPHALGLLERDLTIEVLGTIGLLYIMFLAGLEVNLNEFSKYRNRSILFGAATFWLPQGFGTLMAITVLGFTWPQAILLGSVFASHTLVAYPIVSRLGLSKGQAVTTAVGATIITDTAALLVLAVIAGSAEGGLDAAFWVQLLTLLSVYTLAVLWGLPRLGRWFFRTVRAGDVADFVFILAAVFTCAFLAELAGVESIIGAFLAGLALNRLVPEQSALMNRIAFVGEALFIPFFLISVGMLVDLRVLVGGAGAWMVAGSMVGAVMVTKWLAAMSTRFLFGYSSDQGWMLFGLTVPQAAATLAAALIGFNVGLFDEDVLNGTIVMIMVTCMVGPWVAERYGRRVALQAQQETFEPSEAPRRILVPLANPETAPFLMDLALLIRAPGSEEPVFPLTVARDGEDVQAQVAAGEKLLAHAVVHATAADVPVIPVTRVDHNVASGIGRAIKERLISTVIIGWNGEHTARQFIFGSVLDQLLKESREMVLVSKIEHPLNTVGRVVLAVPPYADREPGFEVVLPTVKTLAAQVGAGILLIAAEDRLPALQKDMQKTRPEVPVTYQPISTWPQLIPALEALLEEDHLLLVLNAREGTLAWRPALNRLPRLIAQRFPRNSFMVIYPPEYVPEAVRAKGAALSTSTFLTLLEEARVTLGLEGHAQEHLLRQMLEPAFYEAPPVLQEAVHSLSAQAPEDAPELLPGVVFYHAHMHHLERPALFLGLSRTGIRLPQAEHPVHVVMILLSPEGESPERHLHRLAEVARLIRSADTVERLRSAISPEEVRRILAAGAHSTWWP